MFVVEEQIFLGIKKVVVDMISDRFIEHSSSQKAR